LFKFITLHFVSKSLHNISIYNIFDTKYGNRGKLDAKQFKSRKYFLECKTGRACTGGSCAKRGSARVLQDDDIQAEKLIARGWAHTFRNPIKTHTLFFIF
jgi:hypothetical protein